MHLIRRRLIGLVLAVIACQMTGAATTSVVLGQMRGAATAADSDEITCTCTHTANAECPMHKHKKPAPVSGESRCRSCDDSQETVLSPLAVFAGVIVQRHQPVVPPRVSAPLNVLFERPLDLSRPPVAPPPRS